MERNNSSRENAGTEEEWLETLSQLLAEAPRRKLWVTIQSKILTLFSIPFRLQVSGRMIHLLLQPKSPSDPDQTEILVYLPEPGYGDYEKRINERGDTRLSLGYPVTRFGDRPSKENYVHLVIATSEEFLTVPDSEALIH